MAQEHKQPRKGSEDEAPVAPPAADAEAQVDKEKLDDDIDAILDEIDEVLESNAEDFVKSFIQKGGE
jgi:prokaryotic ubiquitin-like protein Pup